MSLILSEKPAQRFRLARRVASTGVALVGRTPDGRYQIIQRPGLFSPYSLTFEVDVADHHDVLKATLPSQGDFFEFRLRLVLDWRVTDPIEIVARGITDGLGLCADHLVDQMRGITRQFAIEDSATAEHAIRETIGRDPIVLPEGITVYQVRPQLTIDEATRSAGQARAAARHEGTLAVIKGDHAVAETHRESELLDLRQKAELRRRQEALDAVQSALRGNYDPIALHLAQHPDQTQQLVELIRTDFQQKEERRDELIKDLVKEKLIQDIDVGDLTSSLLGNAADAYQVGPQRNIGAPPVVRGVVAAQHNGSPRPANDGAATDSETPAPPHGSGVAGWRPVPPRVTG